MPQIDVNAKGIAIVAHLGKSHVFYENAIKCPVCETKAPWFSFCAARWRWDTWNQYGLCTFYHSEDPAEGLQECTMPVMVGKLGELIDDRVIDDKPKLTNDRLIDDKPKEFSRSCCRSRK